MRGSNAGAGPQAARRAGGAAAWLAAVSAALALAACGGGGGGGGGDTAAGSTGGAVTSPSAGGAAPAEGSEPAPAPPTRAEAARFLVQASFGPTAAEIDRVVALGYAGWIDDQFGRSLPSLRASWDAADAEIKLADAGRSAGQREFLDAFYGAVLTSDAQLRARMAFALSEIFVVSMQNDSVAGSVRAAAGYVDTLAAGGFGRYRDLLEAVALHPAMGLYLSHLRNQKEDPKTGRVPDENFAREVMQLFSIGLHALNADGSRRTDADGQPLPTYDRDDVEGLAKVFTGWSWAGPDNNGNRFWSATGYRDPDRLWQPMQGYPAYHSTSEKRFLGAVVPAQGGAQPAASLKLALDTLAAHPNVGPFIGRQLIQRFVTSHPSPAYVARVAQGFSASGGDLKATLKAVLLDTEARSAGAAADPAFGKLREPVLRLTALLRAFGASSDSGRWIVGNTDDVASGLGQTPLRAPSVFNFFRPGHIAHGTASGAAGLTVPELQITNEASVAGYANYVRGGLRDGFGGFGVDGRAARRDIQLDLAAEEAMAERSGELVDRVATRLTGSVAPAALRAELVAAVDSLVIPAARADGANAAAIAEARRNRVRIALLLLTVSPEFVVQK